MSRRGLAVTACLACVLVAGAWRQPQRQVISFAALASARSAGAPPGEFALIRSPGGPQSTLELRSAGTGRLVKALGPLGSSWTNNGFAFSHAANAIYLTTIGRATLHIVRVDVATGRRSVVANGEQPAVSFDGRRLAYATGRLPSSVVAVRDLRSGRERRIDLARWLGSSYELLNSSTAWTRDGSTVAVLAAHVAIAGTARARTSGASGASSSPRSCTALRRQPLCLMLIGVPRSGSLTARRISVPVANRGVFTIAGDGRDPRAVYLMGDVGFGGVLYRIDLHTRVTRTTRLVSLPRGLLEAVAPGQLSILYVQGSPPALWRAGIAGGRLTRPREIIANVNLDAASW